jgi:hypothetical protein
VEFIFSTVGLKPLLVTEMYITHNLAHERVTDKEIVTRTGE